jgi:hypothetical protein
MPLDKNLSDREFKLEILKSTLEFGTPEMIRNALAVSDQFVEWCEKPADKPRARSKSSAIKPGQAKAPAV